MFGRQAREENDMSAPEYISRRLQGAGRQVAGETGGRIAKRDQQGDRLRHRHHLRLAGLRPELHARQLTSTPAGIQPWR
jgi:hypothetical protein